VPNLLFVLYSDFASNSAAHVVALANELSALGYDCVVAVADNLASLSLYPDHRFQAVEFNTAIRKPLPFRNGKGPDLVHAWTPRETVRQFCAEIEAQYTIRQFVHLEDNELHLTARLLGLSERQLAFMSEDELESRIPLSLSNPRLMPRFLAQAAGVSVIIDALRSQVPDGVRTATIWPSADEALFHPRPIDYLRRAELGVPINSLVLVYTGNVHAANAHEVRSLYLAVAMLNREGCPTTLIRTGRDFYPFLGEHDQWAKRHAMELGFVESRAELAAVTALADILVQPGHPGAFNDYRFPSKLPEFFALGKPVILPATNIGLVTEHGRDAFVLPQADAVGIVEAVKSIRKHSELHERLATGAREFFERNLRWPGAAARLHEFYQANE